MRPVALGIVLLIAACTLADHATDKKPICNPDCICGCTMGGTCDCHEPEDELEGFWWVQETKEENARQGIVCLHKGKGESYLVTWCYNPGVLQGVAMRVGDKLAVSWVEGGNKLGIVQYEVRRVGGGLHIKGSTEVWTKARPPRGV